MILMEKFKGTKKMVLIANLTAIAIVLGLVENMFNISPVPGAKLGLANLVVLVVLYLFSWKEATLVTLTRVFMVGLLSGNFQVTFWMGLGGALISVIIMSLLKFFKFGIILTSLIGSITHQIGQIIVAILAFDTVEIAGYILIMIPMGIVTGILIGIITDRFLSHYSKSKEDYLEE